MHRRSRGVAIALALALLAACVSPLLPLCTAADAGAEAEADSDAYRHVPQQNAYRWDDRAHNSERVKRLVEWASASGKKPAGSAGGAQPMALVEEGASQAVAARTMLAVWRQRLQYRQHAERTKQDTERAYRNHVARLQMELARKRAEAGSFQEVEANMVRSGGASALHSTMKVAGAVAKLARAAGHVASMRTPPTPPAAAAATAANATPSSVATESTVAATPVAGTDSDGLITRFLERSASLQASQQRLGPAQPVTERVEGADEDDNAATTEAVTDDGTSSAHRFRAGQQSQFIGGLVTGALGALGLGGGGGGGGGGLPQPIKCVMCVYYMEMLERDIGFPQRNSYSDSYPSYAGVNYGGPAAYFKGTNGRTPPVDNMAEPVPGPGFVWLQAGERAQAAPAGRAAPSPSAPLPAEGVLLEQKARASPMNPWAGMGDSASFYSEQANLAQRMPLELASLNGQMKSAQRQRAAPVQSLEEIYAAAQRNGGQAPVAEEEEEVEGGDAVDSAAVYQGNAVPAEDSLEFQRQQAMQWLAQHEPGVASGGKRGSEGGSRPDDVVPQALLEQQELVRAMEYDPNQDPFLGMRPPELEQQVQARMGLATADQADHAPATRRRAHRRAHRRRQTEETLQAADSMRFAEARAGAGAGAGAEVGAQAGAAAAAAAAAGAAANAQFIAGAMKAIKSAGGASECRPGQKFCRPRLSHVGRRGLERRAVIEQARGEEADTLSLMRDSVANMCAQSPPAFAGACAEFMAALPTVAELYLHDYDDEEICSDVGMCSASGLQRPSKPKALP